MNTTSAITWVSLSALSCNYLLLPLIAWFRPVIYFAFLVTISVIWRPSTMSHMLAMSYELSTSEIDCDVELDSMADGPDDIQMPVGPARTMVSVSLDDEDESPKNTNKSLL